MTLLSSTGYQGLNLEDVAERTDIAKAALYHYYSGKDALIAAALEQLTVDVLDYPSCRLESLEGASATEQLRALIGEQLLILTTKAPEVAAVFSWPETWPPQFDELLKDMRRRHDSIFRTIVERGVDEGEFVCQKVSVALQCLHGILNQAAVWVRPQAGNDDLDTVRSEVVDCAMRLFT